MGRFRFIVFILIIISCTEHTENNKAVSHSSSVFDDVLYSVFDSLKEKHFLKNKTIVHFENYSSRLKHFIGNNTISELKGDTTTKAELLRGLKVVIDDSIVLDITKKVKDYNLVWEQKSIEKYIKKNPAFLFFSISNIAFSEDFDLGTFYFAIQCGKNCSGGYFIFVKKVRNKWEVAGIVPIWH